MTTVKIGKIGKTGKIGKFPLFCHNSFPHNNLQLLIRFYLVRYVRLKVKKRHKRSLGNNPVLTV